MANWLRIGIALIALTMLSAPIAYSVSTRPAHEAYFDGFVPMDSDENADLNPDIIVNCGDPDVPGQSKASHAKEHDGDDVLRGGTNERNFNDGMACWGQAENAFWTQSVSEGEKIVAGTPPFYTCMADGVELDLSIQNPFPMYVPEPLVEDDDRFGEYGGEDEFAKNHSVLIASGSFYVIPEISGPDADQVEAVWFSYLETTPTLPLAGEGGGSDETCVEEDRQAATASGAYYEFFRGDIDKSDGWIIPINTLLVPDNVYGAKLTFLGHSDDLGGAVDEGALDKPYPGGLEVLAMGYAYAITDNDEDDTGWQPCTPTEEACANQDTTPPWAHVVPGDIPLADVDDDARLEVIFGEHVQADDTEIQVDRHDKPSEGPVSVITDDPDHHESGVDAVALMDANTDDWGEHWDIDLETALAPCDKIIVSAMDLHGNQASKTAFAGGPNYDEEHPDCQNW